MSKKDPYLDFLNTDSLLFGASVGKDPLKFSDPLSFGSSDPLSLNKEEKKETDASLVGTVTANQTSQKVDRPGMKVFI